VPNHGSTTPIRLSDHVRLLRRHWVIVALGLLLGLGLALAYVSTAEREYVSRASVLVTPIDVDVQDSPGQQAASKVNLDTEAQLVTSHETAAAAAAEMGLPEGEAAALAEDVVVTVPPNSEVLDISFTAGTAETAQRGAAALAQAYLDARQASARAALTAEVQSLQARIDTLDQQLEDLTRVGDGLADGSPELSLNLDQVARITNQLTTLTSLRGQAESAPLSPGRVITTAALPSAPRSPDPFLVLPAGAALGLLVGIGVAALRHRWDGRLRDADDLARRTSVRVAATLPVPLHGDGSDLALKGPNALAVARLENLVSAALEGRARHVVLVAGVREGGREVAANLATALARSGESVCLLDAGAPGPATSSVPEPEAVPAGTGTVVRRTPDELSSVPLNVRLVTLGRNPADPAGAVQRRRITELLDRLSTTSSYVVVHAPPTTESADAQSLAMAADLVVLVVEAGRTRAHEVSEAVAEMEAVRKPVLGAVMVAFGRGRRSSRQPGTSRRRQASPRADGRTTDATVTGDGHGPDLIAARAGSPPAAASGTEGDVDAQEPSLTHGRPR
jgi:Mrp family chromosome partitioning ATPase/capsular polysaccharide biosynthesis protein